MDSATHAQTAGECGNQRGNYRESDQHNDQQGEARDQRRGGGLQYRVDHGDECVEKDHLAIGRGK